MKYKKGQRYKVNGVSFRVTNHKKWCYALTDDYVYHIPFEFAKLYEGIEEGDPVRLSGKLEGDEKKLDDLVVLKGNGTLIIKKGYFWDGCSGPTIDTDTNQRGGLVHDSIYQLMHYKLIKKNYKNRSLTDELFYQLLIKDGMTPFRAKYFWCGVRGFGFLFI